VGLPTDCALCHRDPHEGRFGADCASCHSPGDWKRIVEASFDHAKTRYPLEGAHRDVACAKCHDPVTAGGPKPAFERCDACHDDAHAGTATLAGRRVDCDACHSVRWFRPTTYTAARHAESPYPLEGKHVRVKCESCHSRLEGPEAEARAGRARIDLRPASARCVDCHDDAHAGQLARRPVGDACSSCHDPDGFRPSLFPVARHDSLAFPLEGKHATAGCRACHGDPRELLPSFPAGLELGSARFAFRPPAASCTDCHRDPHRGRFGDGGDRARAEGCRACHGFDSFRDGRFDVVAHAKTRFPLEGAHRALPCFDCHREIGREPAASTRLLAAAGVALDFVVENRSCAGCHDDPHRGQFAARPDGGDCASCHDVGSFRPASRFAHDRDSAFPLKGAHAAVACDKCHRPARPSTAAGGASDASPVTIWRPLSHRCEDCHSTPPDPLEEKSR
jgi:hypothetical protein